MADVSARHLLILARGISGGAEDDPKDDPKGDPNDPDPKDDPKGDPNATDWKEHARTWEDRAKADKKRADDAEDELKKLREANQTEHEKAINDAKEAGKSEVLSEANKRVVKSAVIAGAAGKLADPRDAGALLNLADFEVDEHGDVDDKKIAKAIDDLLKEKPHLAAKGGRPRGDGGGGPRGEPAGGGESMNDLIRRKAGRA